MRKGFSLVEALVALALFQIAMLALAATTMVAARDLGTATRRGRAAAIAAQRVERLRLGACSSLVGTGSQDLPGGFREHWRVDGDTRQRSLTDSITFALPTGRESYVVARAEVLCGS
ncbi:MAG TPA: prepilin-type N-terminal cleavage/methylation domain-containing protein [Gemmatimonadaceae bacterium]|nr:prepilin-type N-terminal cleavage/methylation domain-containing protein [Gemmatimonadaceae bacterium]